MAQPASRQELIDYALRQNGAPVLEINVAEEQLQDLTDDAMRQEENQQMRYAFTPDCSINIQYLTKL